jgi:hypothetical protein
MTVSFSRFLGYKAWTLPRALGLLTLILAIGAMFNPAFAAKTFSDNLNGTVTDPTTGLSWMRCPLGQSLDGNSCIGTSGKYTWAQATSLTNTVQFAGSSDWRLPSIRELQSLYDPSIDFHAFPSASSREFWSSTTYAPNQNGAWYVYFNQDFDFAFANKLSTYQVRLVRGSNQQLSIARPSADYIDHSNGTITHTPTKLMWKQCAEGQSSSAGACIGDYSFFTWALASLASGNTSFAGYSDWRTPTREELMTLVDYTAFSPAINAVVFPSTLSREYWTGSKTTNGNTVSFSDGEVGISNVVNTKPLRLVRGGGTVAVSLNLNKTGRGTILNSLGNIYCGSICSSQVSKGTVITLSTISDFSSTFSGWSGACSGSASTCTVTMDASTSVTANFKDTSLASGLPSLLSYATQNIGTTSGAQIATLSNAGAGAMTISSITSTGDFGVTHSCGSGLNSGGFCTLNITFKPTAEGTRIGSVIITSNAPGSPHSIALSGIGQGGTGQLGSSALSYAAQSVGTTSAAQTLTFRNTGLAALNIAGIVSSGDFVRTTTCGATLAIGANCSISVSFSPTALGARNGTVVITSDATNSPATVSLTGTGVAAPVVSLSPANLSFVWPTLGSTSAAQTITLTNSGGVALTQTSITANGDFAVSNNCGAGLGAGGFCAISVTFTPTTTGTRTGSITVVSNAPGSPHTVNLTGVIGTLTPPVCTLNAAPVVVSVGNSATLTATCTPTATSYTWTNSGFASTAGNGTVSPTRPTLYTVTGSNAAGGGNPASAAVYVCNTPPTENYTGLTLTGTGANEQLRSGIAADTIDGGPGFDSVIYQCNKDSFTMTRTASGWTVSSAAEGIDTLSNVERIQFGDRTLALDISGIAGQAYRIYQAAFNRVPDNGGLKFWIASMDGGATLRDVAIGFVGSPEFQSVYGSNPTNEQFVIKLYNNVLHRDPDAGGKAYWLDLMDRGLLDKVGVLMQFSESPENQAGVLNAIINGIDLLN